MIPHLMKKRNITQNLMYYKEMKIPVKSPARRVFFLTRAMNRAKNPEFKELWKRKKEELLRIYNK